MYQTGTHGSVGGRLANQSSASYPIERFFFCINVYQLFFSVDHCSSFIDHGSVGGRLANQSSASYPIRYTWHIPMEKRRFFSQACAKQCIM